MKMLDYIKSDLNEVVSRNTKKWNNIYRTHGGLEYPHELLVIFVSRLNQKADRALRALEFGFGSIADMHMLFEKGYETWGLDVSENAVLKAQQKSDLLGIPLHLSAWTPGALPFNDKYFDLFCSSNALHFNLNQNQILSEVNRVLKKSGKIYATYLAPGHRFLNFVDMVDEDKIRFSSTHPVSGMQGLIMCYFNHPDKLVNLYEGHFRDVSVTRFEYKILGYQDAYWVVTAAI